MVKMEKYKQLIQKLSAVIPKERILEAEPMARHTSFRVGGAADLFVELESVGELSYTLCALNENNLSRRNTDYFVIGNASNILVSDSGIRGVVLKLSKAFSNITVNDGITLTCEAGAGLAAVARFAMEHSLSGFEFASGIPGTIGGAVVMNAGAYGGEMSRVVSSVELMDSMGNTVVKSADEMHFAYRHSLLKEEDWIVTRVSLKLREGNKRDIADQMAELADKRREKQPLDYPSAGSAFKRPEGYFAAALIDEAGLRGYTVGGAQVSEKHCGFVINRSDATADDIYRLMNDVKKRVRDRFGVELEPEVVMLGEF